MEKIEINGIEMPYNGEQFARVVIQWFNNDGTPDEDASIEYVAIGITDGENFPLDDKIFYYFANIDEFVNRIHLFGKGDDAWAIDDILEFLPDAKSLLF